MITLEKRKLNYGYIESHMKRVVEYMDRKLTGNLGPKAEAGSTRSESGYQRIAASVSGRIAGELGCSQHKAMALSMAVGMYFPKYGHEGLNAVKQYIIDRNIDLDLDTLGITAACYCESRYNRGTTIIVSTAFYNLVYDYFYGIDSCTESKIVRLVQDTIMDVKKAEAFYDGNPGDLLFDATHELAELAKANKTLTKGTLLDKYKNEIDNYRLRHLTDEERQDIIDSLDKLVAGFTSYPEDLKHLSKTPEEAVLAYIVTGLFVD